MLAGGRGHLAPVVAAARALGRLGHEAVVLVPPSVSEAAADAEVAFRVGDQPPQPVIDEIWERVRAGPPEAVVGVVDRDLFADRCTEAMLSAAREVQDAWRPEAVVREPCEYATGRGGTSRRFPSCRSASRSRRSSIGCRRTSLTRWSDTAEA